jgi:hypothetical protein
MGVFIKPFRMRRLSKNSAKSINYEREVITMIRVEGNDIKDGDKKIGVINGMDIFMTYPTLKRVGQKWSDGDVFDASGKKIGYGNEGVLMLFL